MKNMLRDIKVIYGLMDIKYKDKHLISACESLLECVKLTKRLDLIDGHKGYKNLYTHVK